MILSLYLISPTLGIANMGELLLKLNVARDFRAANCDLVSEVTLDRVPQLNERKSPEKIHAIH